MSAMAPQLFEPFRLGSMGLRNRIVMPAMVTNFGAEDGSVTKQLIDYHTVRARGGAALLIVEATSVDASVGRSFRRQLRIDDDRFIPGLAELARSVKKHGAKIAVQLHHGGSEARTEVTGRQPVAPSPIAKPGGDPPRELTGEEIGRLIEQFAQAAARVKEAGCDGVELHCAHGYLIAQFLSSFFNQRTDAYGGGMLGRGRFLVEAVSLTKKLVGADYPVWCRINGKEMGPEGGLTVEEAQQAARMAQEAGADAINVSLFAYGFSAKSVAPMAQPYGSWVRYVEPIKNAVSVPVIAVGRFSPATAEAALSQGKADLIAIGRGLIADPELPNKAAAGSLDEIRPCLSCYTCLDGIGEQHSLQCMINPTVGRESAGQIFQAALSKRVFVVGGGPAGMEAARVNALKGHVVTLFERSSGLGGQLLVAAIPPSKEVLSSFTKYQSSELARLGVKVELGREADARLIREGKPDVVFFASGGLPVVPQIPGVDRANVVNAVDVLAGKVNVGKDVVVIGAELVGCETAEFLVDRGHKVTLMRRGSEVATKVKATVRKHLIARLALKGVVIVTGVHYEGIDEEGVTVTTADGRREKVCAHTLVLASGSRPDRAIREAVEDNPPMIYDIGDCVEPQNLMAALSDAFWSALKA